MKPQISGVEIRDRCQGAFGEWVHWNDGITRDLLLRLVTKANASANPEQAIHGEIVATFPRIVDYPDTLFAMKGAAMCVLGFIRAAISEQIIPPPRTRMPWLAVVAFSILVSPNARAFGASK